MGVREKWSLRYVVGPRSIHNTDRYLCKFSVPRGGVEKPANEKQENRNADKGAHGLTPTCVAPRHVDASRDFCERSELLIWQVHQFGLGCIKNCAH